MGVVGDGDVEACEDWQSQMLFLLKGLMIRMAPGAGDAVPEGVDDGDGVAGAMRKSCCGCKGSGASGKLWCHWNQGWRLCHRFRGRSRAEAMM